MAPETRSVHDSTATGHTFADVKTSRMRLVDATGTELCRYEPAMGGRRTAPPRLLGEVLPGTGLP